MNDFITNNLNIRNQEHLNFSRIFGVTLNSFFDNLFGFDIVKFDEDFIKTPDDQSMEEYIQEKYGEKGVAVIKRLIANH